MAAVSADLLTYKCILLLLYNGADITIQDHKGNGALDTMLNALQEKPGTSTCSRRRLGEEKCMCLLYAAGDKPRQEILCDNMDTFRDINNMLIYDDQVTPRGHLNSQLDHWKVFSLSNQCRKQIRKHLLSPAGGKHSNLLLAIPRLPLPTRLQQFLVFFVDIKMNNQSKFITMAS